MKTEAELIRLALLKASESRRIIKLQTRLHESYCKRCRRRHSPVMIWRGRERTFCGVAA